jgi:hypothetical protein
MAAAALMMLSASAWGAGKEKPRPPQAEPWVTISLKSLGVPPIPPAFVQAGASMLTMDLVDDTHVLLTFSTRDLVPRIPGDPPEDEDRMVATELVDLPSGRVMARADWHMHDHGRYLWRLGKGRFLLRSRRDLFVITPEARMNTDEPLRALRFPTSEGMPLAAMVSPDQEMLMVETMAPAAKDKLETGSGGLIVNEAKPEVTIDFYRLTGGDAAGTELSVKRAGTVLSPEPILLPVDGDGYLWAGDPDRRGRWPVSFNEFGGREVQVGTVDSSCAPRLQMVSRFEYLAFACMSTADRSHMKAYGMDGHETWEESLGGTFGVPEFVFAPAAGRFAMSRIVSAAADEGTVGLGNALPGPASQEMRVYQTESGDLLLKVATTPVTRFAENFDLSEDGLVAAVVTNGEVEVYRLAAPSKQDLKDLEVARSFSPPVSEAPVRLAKLETGESGAGEGSGAPGAGEPGAAGGGKDVAAAAGAGSDVRREDVSAQRTAQAGQGDQAGGAAAGDAVGDGEPSSGPRKPPTLLEPGETVEQVKGSGQTPPK